MPSSGPPPPPAVVARLVQVVHATRGAEAAVTALELCASKYPRDAAILQLQCRAHAALDPLPSSRGLELFSRLARVDPVNSELAHAVELVLSHRSSRCVRACTRMTFSLFCDVASIRLLPFFLGLFLSLNQHAVSA